MNMNTTDVKDEPMGWKAQVLSLYQKYFKGEHKDNAEVPREETVNAGGKGRLRSAGEFANEEGNTLDDDLSSEHTVVEVPPPASTESVEAVTTSTPSIITTVQETPKVEEQKDSGVEPSSDQSKNTLVIKNLPFKFKPADLDKLLGDFQAKPKNVRLLRDDAGRFAGMAFIRCPSKEEAQRLISSMNGLDISGRNIQVEFKLKKKKGKGNKLDSSCDSLASSSDELPVNRLKISSEFNPASVEPTAKPIETTVLQQQAPIIVQSVPQLQQHPAPRMNKLSVSAEHSMIDKQPHPLKKAPLQTRRKSTSSTGEHSLYLNSAMPKLHLESLPNVRPVRQPRGPDGTNGFSLEWRRSRGLKV